MRADPIQRLHDDIALQTEIQRKTQQNTDILARAVRSGKLVIG